jgi:hypothetical protein
MWVEVNFHQFFKLGTRWWAASRFGWFTPWFRLCETQIQCECGGDRIVCRTGCRIEVVHLISRNLAQEFRNCPCHAHLLILTMPLREARILQDLKLSRRQDSIKSSRAISRVRWIKETVVSRTISAWGAILIHMRRRKPRYHIISLMMRTEMVLETSVSFIHLTRLITREDFIEEFYNSYYWVLA